MGGVVFSETARIALDRRRFPQVHAGKKLEFAWDRTFPTNAGACAHVRAPNVPLPAEKNPGKMTRTKRHAWRS